MSLDDDILSEEFNRNKNTGSTIDVEFTSKPRPNKRIQIAAIGGGILLIIIIVTVFFISGGNDHEEVNQDKVNLSKAKVESKSAELPPDLAQISGESKSETDTHPGGYDDKTPVKPDSAETTVQPIEMASFKPQTSPAPAPMVSNESGSFEGRVNDVEQKVDRLTTTVDDLSKKLDALASDMTKLSTAKSSVQVERPRPRNYLVTKSMKDLKITALLSDGVVFEGDIAISVGSYSKTLQGKILSVSPESNTITTDNYIYKVQ